MHACIYFEGRASFLGGDACSLSRQGCTLLGCSAFSGVHTNPDLLLLACSLSYDVAHRGFTDGLLRLWMNLLGHIISLVFACDVHVVVWMSVHVGLYELVSLWDIGRPYGRRKLQW